MTPLKKKLSKFYISTQFKLVEIKVWTYKYILLRIVSNVSLFSSFTYTVLWLLLLLGLITYCFVTSGVHFLLKITHSNTICWLLSSWCTKYWGLCVHLGNNYTEWTYYLKKITSCLLACLHVCKWTTCFNSMLFFQCYIVWVKFINRNWVKYSLL